MAAKSKDTVQDDVDQMFQDAEAGAAEEADWDEGDLLDSV